VSQPRKADQAGPREGLSAITSDWLDRTAPAARKALGQYMTPRPVADALAEGIGLRPGMRTLDPGVGTGELLRAVLDRQPELEATGWDIDETAVEAARRLVPEAELEVRSALDPERDSELFDLVIGNPPYFQLRLSPADRRRFAGVISGRANIFALFFQLGFERLRPGGTLAYIVPPSMNSGAYFEALREHITERAVIEDLTILDETDIFEGANTAVQLLVLKKREPSPEAPGEVGRISGVETGNPTHRKFIFRREATEAGFRRVLFSSDPGRLAKEFVGRKTLWEFGLEAVTGQVIWNQNRDRLAQKSGPGRVRLIWSHDIGAGELRVGKPGGRPEKPGFYDSRDGGRRPLTGPAIVVNRVVGAVGRGELRAALIPEGEEFLAENHVNVVRPRRTGEADQVDWEAVLTSLRRPGIVDRVRLLTGNTQISARELTHLLPLD